MNLVRMAPLQASELRVSGSPGAAGAGMYRPFRAQMSVCWVIQIEIGIAIEIDRHGTWTRKA